LFSVLCDWDNSTFRVQVFFPLGDSIKTEIS
jgi:hypothetical protein